MLLDKANELGIRITAAMALGLIRDEAAVGPLISVLNDSREVGSVQRSVLKALFEYPGDTAAAPVLEFMKAHPQEMASLTSPKGGEVPQEP